MIEVMLEGRLMTSVPISLATLNRPHPSEADYLREAKRCVIEDGTLTVQQAEQATYRLRYSDV